MANTDLTGFKDQHDSIRAEFRRQAASWAKDEISPDLQWVVARLDLRPHFDVLDVAAGTGLLSRAIAPHVNRVVAVDITPEMLAVGRAEATRRGMTSITFEQGTAEGLTFSRPLTRLVSSAFTSPPKCWPSAAPRPPVGE